MPDATYSVLVGWEAVPANAFVISGSQLDSSNVLTSSFSSFLDLLQFDVSTFGGTDKFGGPYDGLYAEVTDRVKRIAVKRGRSDNLDQFAAGEATIVLHDPDGKYNPLNTSSPLYPNVVPGRQVLVEATYGGVAYGIYRGFVRSIEHDPSPAAQETRLMCQDLFLYLSRAKPALTASLNTTTGAAIGRVLDAVGWTDTALRSLGTGDAIAQFGPFQSTDTALSIVQGLLETERGEFFHGKDGVVRFRDRYARYRQANAATFTDVATGVGPATDLTNVRNRATVGNGTFSQTAEDGVSVANYGANDYPPISSAYIASPQQAASLAQWLVKQAATPSPPVRGLEFVANTSAALLTNALAREVGDKITVFDSAAGVNGAQFFIEGIEHNIEQGGKRHAVRFALSKVADAAPIIFGTSRVVNGDFSSPTTGTAPYTTPDTASDIFVY